MSEKTDSKKQLIIDKATEVFAAKGFKAVTMKDIVDACEISRGGLYLYYSSTEEIFKDVIEAEESKEAGGNDFQKMLANSVATDLLLWFMKEQKKEILKRKNSLIVAKYEYAFFNKANGNTQDTKKAFETAVAVLANIIERGNASGEFACLDSVSMACSMMYAIEGMRACSATFGLSEKKVDSELLFMMNQLVEV